MSENKSQLEIELKLEAFPGLVMPDSLDSYFTLVEKKFFNLVAVYYDTSDARLASNGIALRRRQGGYDDGWHIKRKLNKNTQLETIFALTDEIPAQVFAELAEYLPNGSDLIPVAEINTSRSANFYADDTGKVVLEVADDEVVTKSHITGQVRAWREWEIELMADCGVDAENGKMILSLASQALLSAGAVHSLSDSKIGRAVGALSKKALLSNQSLKLVQALAIQDLADCIAGDIVTGIVDANQVDRIIKMRNSAFLLMQEATYE